MFEFVKSLNNNIVLAYDENHNEVVLFGTGIGFNRKRGDMVSESSVSKFFLSTAAINGWLPWFRTCRKTLFP